jgi:hypothetical protein
MKKCVYFIALLCFGLSLTGCQYIQGDKDGNRQARCKEIRSQMTFNGSTSVESNAFQARSEQAKLNESYHDNDCV